MKKISKALSILTVVTMLVSVVTLCTISTNAAQQGNTTLGFTPPGEPAITYQLSVSIVGNGSIFDGTQEIIGSIKYELSANQSKTFRVQPQQGYMLASVVFDNTNITNKVDMDGNITIQGKTYDSQLVITFEEELVAGVPPENDDTSSGTDSIPPNDSSDSNDGGTTQGGSSSSTGGNAHGNNVQTGNTTGGNNAQTGDTTGVTAAIAAIVLFLCGTTITVFVLSKKKTKIHGSKSE